jgi:hypothetical protein
LHSDVAGKLPATAGWQPALPGYPRSLESYCVVALSPNA